MERRRRPGVSKGTVYQHFTSKEDLLAAVLLRSADIRARLFARGELPGSKPRADEHRGAAVELFFALYPQHEQAERAIKAGSISEKIDAKRAAGLESCTFRCFGVATGIVRDAIASGSSSWRRTRPSSRSASVSGTLHRRVPDARPRELHRRTHRHRPDVDLHGERPGVPGRLRGPSRATTTTGRRTSASWARSSPRRPGARASTRRGARPSPSRPEKAGVGIRIDRPS